MRSRASFLRRAPWVLLLVTVSPGCDVSPTEIVGAPLLFEGTVAFESTAAHDFSVASSGGVRVRVESLTADPPLAEGLLPSLGFGFGEPSAEGTCAISFSSGINEGTSFAFGLQERTYCIRLFDNGTLTEDATRTYALRVSPSE